MLVATKGMRQSGASLTALSIQLINVTFQGGFGREFTRLKFFLFLPFGQPFQPLRLFSIFLNGFPRVPIIVLYVPDFPFELLHLVLLPTQGLGQGIYVAFQFVGLSDQNITHFAV